MTAQMPVGTPIATVQGETFTVAGALVVTDERGRASNIVGTDVLTSNGVIYVLDKAILPAS